MRSSLTKIFIVALLATVGAKGSIAATGNSYRIDLLATMAKAMGISSKLDTLGNGEYGNLFTYNRRAVTVVVKDSVVTHLGYSIFPSEMKQTVSSPICDFLERYTLELDLPIKGVRSKERRIAEDGISFKNGNLNTFATIKGDTTLTVSIDNLGYKRYTVSWKRDDKEVFAVNFPIEYDLLNGTDMIENERRIVEDLKNTRPATITSDSISDGLLTPTWQGKYFIHKGEEYYTPLLTTNKYYVKNGGKYELLCNTSFPIETLANLLTTNVIDNDIEIEIKLIKYPLEQEVFKVSLNQWVTYCLEKGCKIFFGVISDKDDVCECELIVLNREWGYNHSMKLRTDLGVVRDLKGVMRGRLNCYIPTPRIKYLFEEIKK